MRSIYYICSWFIFWAAGFTLRAQDHDMTLPKEREALRKLADADSIIPLPDRETGVFSGLFFARSPRSKQWGVFNKHADPPEVLPMMFDSLVQVHHPVYAYLGWRKGKLGLIENKSWFGAPVVSFSYQDGLYALDARQNHYILVREKGRWKVLDARSRSPLSDKTWTDPWDIPLPPK